MNCIEAIQSLVKENITTPEKLKDEKKLIGLISDRVGSSDPEKLRYLRQFLLTTGGSSFVYCIMKEYPSETGIRSIKNQFNALKDDDVFPFFNCVILALGGTPFFSKEEKEKISDISDDLIVEEKKDDSDDVISKMGPESFENGIGQTRNPSNSKRRGIKGNSRKSLEEKNNHNYLILIMEILYQKKSRNLSIQLIHVIITPQA
jgi:hypothetical protein